MGVCGDGLMTHRKDLIKKGYRSQGYGTKRQMQFEGKLSKEKGARNYRVVYSNEYNLYELYAKW